jgi:hypothetical protein
MVALHQGASFADYQAEGAAFGIDYHISDDLKKWLAEAKAIPEAELREMINPPGAVSELSMFELLKKAAHFADDALMFGSCGPMTELRQYLPYPDYMLFCSPDVLREIFGSPFARRKKSEE